MIGRYEYRCTAGHVIRNDIRANVVYCPSHDVLTIARRVFGFSFKRPMVEHINSTTGQYVRTEQQFNTQLKRMSEAASIRTGISHTFVPITNTPSAHGVTEQGLYEQARAHHDKQIPDSTPTTLLEV